MPGPGTLYAVGAAKKGKGKKIPPPEIPRLGIYTGKGLHKNDYSQKKKMIATLF